MFNKKNRLAKTKDIQKTIKSGRVFFNPSINLKFFSKPDARARFTIVVGTKVFKKATQRNRVKRILREEVKKNILFFPSGDYMVFVKPKAGKISEEELIKNLKTVLKQATNV